MRGLSRTDWLVVSLEDRNRACAALIQPPNVQGDRILLRITGFRRQRFLIAAG